MSKIGYALLVIGAVFSTPALAQKKTITITESKTVTTSTKQGTVDVGGNTYVYGQKQTFQPSPTGGNTNPYNTDRTTYGVGIGWRF